MSEPVGARPAFAAVGEAWGLRKYYLERLGIHLRNRRLVFFEVPLPAVTPTPKPPDPYRIVRLSRAEFEALGYPRGALSRQEALEWLERRDCRLFAALDQEEIMGSCWLEMDQANLSFFDLSAELGGRTAYISGLSVHPRARKKGLALNLLAAVMQQAASEGRSRAVLGCVPENVPMFRATARLGWRRFQTVRYFRLLGLRRYGFQAAEGGARAAFWRCEPASRNLLHLYSQLAVS